MLVVDCLLGGERRRDELYSIAGCAPLYNLPLTLFIDVISNLIMFTCSLLAGFIIYLAST